MTNKHRNDKFSIVIEWSCKCLTNDGKKQHQPTKHRVISYLKWNRREIDSNRIVHSWENALLFQTRSADRATQGQLNESEGLRAQVKLGTGTGGAFTIPFAHSSFLARYRWRPRVSRVSTESTERCQVKSKAIKQTIMKGKGYLWVQNLG